MQDDDLYNDLKRRQKIEQFHLDITEDETDQSKSSGYYPGRRFPRNGEENSDKVIHSYSDPRAAQAEQMQAEERAEKAHRMRNRQKGRKNRIFFRIIWLIMVLTISALLSQFAISGINDMLAVGREKVSLTVEVPKNSSTDQIARILYRAGLIQDMNFFKLYSKLTKADGHYGNGSYKLDTSMDYQALINNLQSNLNRVDTVKITFPEGTNTLEMAALLEKNGVCKSKDFLNAVNSSQFDSKFELAKAISNSSKRYYRLEGYLFPDTYEFYKDEEPKTIIPKLLNNCDKKLTTDIRNSAGAQKMSVDQLLTLASMIQAEAANKDDMYVISSIFHNRLDSTKDDLKRLRSDPTTYYPYRNKASVPSNLRDTYKSRYDTYTLEGLPPGPICNPGEEAINAALNPASTSYYYFCHDKDRKPYYARTMAQHEANLKKAGLK